MTHAPRRRDLLKLSAAGLAWPALGTAAASAADAPKTLRYAFRVAETGFDPPQVSDLYSLTITAHIFEALYGYDYLAEPVKIKPLTAAALPEVSADYKTWTIRLRPGIFFAEDEAFGGRRRELVAEDYVYSFKRFADPKVKSPQWNVVDEWGVLGLAELRRAALASQKPFDYDRAIEGLRALDRYTLQIRLAKPRPRLLEPLARCDLFGALAREVVERYGSDIMAHPVGTGPFRLAQWRRSSLITLEKNPGFREMLYEAEPAAGDAEGQALLARFKGRRLPMVDRVEVSIIEEDQPRWLSFLNGEHDLLERLPNDYVDIALPHGKLAPNLAKRGLQLHRTLGAECTFTTFNMEDPLLGGYTPERVALRRAIGLGLDVDREIGQIRHGQAIRAQSLVAPHTNGYRPDYRSEMGDYDLARARALLDLYGYRDRDGDGWREQPDGAPLVVEIATQPDAQSRQYDELWQRNFAAVGLKTRFKQAKWPEQLKAVRAGKFSVWYLADTANVPDGQLMLQRLYGPQSGSRNLSRFRNAAFDAIYERMQQLPDGPEREALFIEAKRLQAVWMPVKSHVHRILNDVSQPWLIGYRRPLFRYEFWQYLDIAARPQ
ncbi:ABC transporter substrate-binding protein [Paucibacter sp. APW11]|uniref:ABC transporter substrate-binding protein n=1 Tax=Roseateles aquae TaxID=3077235 RepID=A0ABU3PEU3_9BURK|nr:ABC transporter substrate-binding protein [Paucibacter sp. APW11]MDT9001099.1 ABC transporter substrate-binding protein [Paucibacter sp. APW11]